MANKKIKNFIYETKLSILFEEKKHKPGKTIKNNDKK